MTEVIDLSEIRDEKEADEACGRAQKQIILMMEYVDNLKTFHGWTNEEAQLLYVHLFDQTFRFIDGLEKSKT